MLQMIDLMCFFFTANTFRLMINCIYFTVIFNYYKEIIVNHMIVISKTLVYNQNFKKQFLQSNLNDIMDLLSHSSGILSFKLKKRLQRMFIPTLVLFDLLT